MGINRKNIYHKSIKDMKDQTIKTDIEYTFLTHPAYGHRRLALELNMNHKRILRIMRKYHLKPPRLWYTRRYTTQSDSFYLASYHNLFFKSSDPERERSLLIASSTCLFIFLKNPPVDQGS